MRVETHNNLRQPVVIPKATRIVIYDDLGNPIGVFIEAAHGAVIAEIADNNTEFQKLLRDMGVAVTTIVDVRAFNSEG